MKRSDITGVNALPGIMTALTICLALLKKQKVLNLSWWQVFSPIWGPLSVLILAIGTFGVAAGLIAWLEANGWGNED